MATALFPTGARFPSLNYPMVADPGRGNGLSIVKHIVEAHGGKVLVRSAPGQGSRFTIELPLESQRRRKDAKRIEPQMDTDEHRFLAPDSGLASPCSGHSRATRLPPCKALA